MADMKDKRSIRQTEVFEDDSLPDSTSELVISDAEKTGQLKGVRCRIVMAKLRASISVGILVAAAAIFVFLLIDVTAGDVIGLDRFAYRLFVIHLRTTWLTGIMEGFSGLASPVTVVVMLIVVAAFAPGPNVGRLACINLVSALAVDLIFKAIVQRPRPDGFRLVAETGYSFPSGHSMFSMAFYGFLIWLVWHYEKDNLQRWLFCLSFAFIIIMIGISRIYLGVHYASDVLGGYSLALVWLVLFTKLMVPALIRKPHDKDATPQRLQ